MSWGILCETISFWSKYLSGRSESPCEKDLRIHHKPQLPESTVARLFIDSGSRRFCAWRQSTSKSRISTPQFLCGYMLNLGLAVGWLRKWNSRKKGCGCLGTQLWYLTVDNILVGQVIMHHVTGMRLRAKTFHLAATQVYEKWRHGLCRGKNCGIHDGEVVLHHGKRKYRSPLSAWMFTKSAWYHHKGEKIVCLT